MGQIARRRLVRMYSNRRSRKGITRIGLCLGHAGERRSDSKRLPCWIISFSSACRTCRKICCQEDTAPKIPTDLKHGGSRHCWALAVDLGREVNWSSSCPASPLATYLHTTVDCIYYCIGDGPLLTRWPLNYRVLTNHRLQFQLLQHTEHRIFLCIPLNCNSFKHSILRVIGGLHSLPEQPPPHSSFPKSPSC